MNEMTVLVVDAITRCCNGWLPADTEAIVDTLEQLPCLRDEPDERVRQIVRDELILELKVRLAVQDSLVIFNQVTFLN